MAFEEITLFEFDLQDAQFGPGEMDLPDRMTGSVDTESADEDVEVDVESEESSGGPSLGRLIVMAVVVSVAATVVARRFRGGEEEEETTQIEFDEDEEEAPEIGA